MDKSLFGDEKTGNLVKIETISGSDFAFIPNALPPDWTFPHRLWPLLAEAKSQLSKLDGIGRTLPNPQLLLIPLRRREALTSSKLEGTYATAQELLLFEMSPQDPKSETDQANAWREVSNYNRTLAEGANKLNELPLCLRITKDLHKILLENVRGSSANPGEFRTHQVAIGSDRRYIPPPPTQMETCLHELESYLNTEDQRFDPLVRAYLVHYQIEAIHPFADGNGRIGRVLLSLMIYKWLEHYMPWLYISPFFERYKDEYIDNLFKISTIGDWEKWIEFCLRGTVIQAKDSIRRCDALKSLRDEMQKIARKNGTPRSAHIIDELFGNPFVRIADLAREHDVSYPTAKNDAQHLEKCGILKKIDGVSPITYCATEIYKIAYEPNQDL